MGEPRSGCPDDDEGPLPNGDDLEAGLSPGSGQPEEAGAALRPDAGPASNCDDCRCDQCADDAEMPCIRDPIWTKHYDDERPDVPFPEDRRLFASVSEY